MKKGKAPQRAHDDPWETVEVFGSRARVSWSPKSREYCLELDDNFITAPNRGDIVAVLAKAGIEWKPWEVKMK